ARASRMAASAGTTRCACWSDWLPRCVGAASWRGTRWRPDGGGMLGGIVRGDRHAARHPAQPRCAAFRGGGGRRALRARLHARGRRHAITHTEVPPPAGGRGVAGELVRSALDFARAKGWKVAPLGSYAGALMARHPDYAALRA